MDRLDAGKKPRVIQGEHIICTHKPPWHKKNLHKKLIIPKKSVVFWISSIHLWPFHW